MISALGAPTDGSAWVGSPRDAYRVGRGGGWFVLARDARAARRDDFHQNYYYYYLGFRPARSVSP
ncbi:MAG: hypothetical protein JW797_02645 [Bradymonadales bacterium]|nr:hypothetical protein [Bradymonadales bacterium]